MQIKGQTPPVVRRAALFVSNEPPEPKPARARREWQWVIAQCGHVCADDMEIVALNAIISKFQGVKVYCDTCGDFINAVRKATLKDTIARITGIVPLPILEDAPPPF